MPLDRRTVRLFVILAGIGAAALVAQGAIGRLAAEVRR